MSLTIDGKQVRVCLMVLVGMFAFAVPFFANASVEESVRAFFKEDPVMIEIARCESKFRQLNADGSVLRGGWGGGMIGVFQVYESVHSKGASLLGYDLSTLEGNMGYAQHLYATQGTAPWNSAKSCWGRAQVTSRETTDDTEELQKKIRQLEKLVAQLQKLLAEKKVVVRS